MAKRRKRKKWSDDEKRMICTQTVVPGDSATQVARRYDLNANQIFNWLKDPKFAPGEQADDDEAKFLSVEVIAEPNLRRTFRRVSKLIRFCHRRKGPFLAGIESGPWPSRSESSLCPHLRHWALAAAKPTVSVKGTEFGGRTNTVHRAA